MKILCLLACVSTVGLSASNLPHSHSFSPKFFYLNHDEINYKYDTWGVGLQYVLSCPQGINVTLSMATNPQSKNVLVQTEERIFYKNVVADMHSIYPIFSSRTSTHTVFKGIKEAYIIKKSSLYAGMGWEWNYKPDYCAKFELHTFRDVYNAVIVRNGDAFKGISYTNPWGVQVKGGVVLQWGSHSIIEAEGHYARTLSTCYSEYGAEISFNWRI